MMRVSYSGIRPGMALIPVVLLVACGGLESPVGDVSGRIIGASAGAYAYPFGQPALKTQLAIDASGVGTFTFRDLPANAVSAIVLYDGSDRAELVPVTMEGGRVNRLADRYGAAATLSSELLRMPLAGTLLAAAVPDGGATPWQPTFDLPQTDHANLTPSSGGVYTVWPLPAGQFGVSASLTGFKGGATTVHVVSGMTMTAPVTLPIDLGAARPGCGSAPGCENGLVCEPLDGRCYECTAGDASLCSAGCDVATHLCKAPAPAASTYCSPCTTSVDCGSSQVSNMYCRKSDDSTTGYCTRSGCSSDSDCPAGFGCSESICRPPNGCGTWIQTMGAACYSGSSTCSYGLKNGWCQGAGDDHPGTCTAGCRSDLDCHVGSGFNSTYSCKLTVDKPYCGP